MKFLICILGVSATLLLLAAHSSYAAPTADEGDAGEPLNNSLLGLVPVRYPLSIAGSVAGLILPELCFPAISA
jgi:hypothetical protein